MSHVAQQLYLSSSSLFRHIRHIIDGFARSDGFDTADEVFSISLAFVKLVKVCTGTNAKVILLSKLQIERWKLRKKLLADDFTRKKSGNI